MQFHAATSMAILACAAHVASAEAQPEPYKLAVMPLLGMSLMRRGASGYQPEQSQCHEGNTCSEACGSTFTECPSQDDVVHCYNPAAKQNCCSDGSGNSCDEGYYCTHDHALQTWCCPDSMDLAACAAAYSVPGGLETASSTIGPASTSSSSTGISSSSSTGISSTALTTASAPTIIVSLTAIASPTTTSMPTTSSTPAVTQSEDKTTTVYTSSAGSTSTWSGFNSTVTSAAPTQPAGSSPPSQNAPSASASISTGAPQTPSPSIISSAATSSFSALLLLAAGVVALL